MQCNASASAGLLRNEADPGADKGQANHGEPALDNLHDNPYDDTCTDESLLRLG